MDEGPRTKDQTMGNSFSYYNEYEYDSTWEDEQDHEGNTEVQSAWHPYRNTYAAKDMQYYRHYCELTLADDRTGDDEDVEDDKDSPNVQFYRNKRNFYPNGVCIEDFHKYWSEDYDKLEYVHSYIQWLFPIQEKGMNYASQELSLKEIKLFRRDEEVRRRLLQSYKIMLGFYGIQLVSEETGEVKRAENWRARFENLNRNTHNNLRITRILKCLGLLGFRHYQKPLVHFFLEQALVNRTLPQVKQSILDYFMFAVLDKGERKELIKFAFLMYMQKEKFVWCPRRIRAKLLKEIETKRHNSNADPSKGVSSDSTSQSDQNDLMDSRVQDSDELKTDTNKGTSNENVSGECQDSEKQALPDTPAGNANTSDTNEGFEAPSGADSEHDEDDEDSEDEAAIQNDDSKVRNLKMPDSVQKDTEKSDEKINEDADSTKESKVLSGDKNFDNSTASDERTNESLTRTSNHSSRSDNVANETSQSGTRQQVQDKQGDELPEDGVATGTETNNKANSAHYHAETSADKNSHNYTLCLEEANASSRSFASTSEQNSVSSKKIHTQKTLKDGQQESDRGNELLNEPKAEGNLEEEREQQNQRDETLNQLKATTEAKEQAKEKKGDPVHRSSEDDTEDGLTDEGVSNIVTTINNETSDSTDAKNRNDTLSEQGTALRSDGNSSQDVPCKTTETGESSNGKSVKDEGETEKEETNLHSVLNVV